MRRIFIRGYHKGTSTMATQRELTAAAKQLARILAERDLKIVFAESCTGGLISAAMTKIPGISTYLCGSAVVYQVETKHGWLGIGDDILRKPGPVSRVVAAEMATRVLAQTPHASVAASVTGHLGPDAPKKQDGLMYAAVALRVSGKKNSPADVIVKRHRLETAAEDSPKVNPAALRSRRQVSAAHFVISLVQSRIEIL